MHRYRALRFVSIDMEFEDGGVSEISGEEDTEDTVLRKVEAQELRRLLGALMPREREIVHRHFIQGESQKSIAADIGVSESRISQIQRRALFHLRSMLTERALPLAA
jgi:RNA polymerase sigma factor (sigma-70 family)